MKMYYVLSIIAVSVVSTLIATGLVAADTPKIESSASMYSPTLEALKAQAAASTTWQRPL